MYAIANAGMTTYCEIRV